MHPWCAQHVLKSDKQKAAVMLQVAADWFRDELGSAQVVLM